MSKINDNTIISRDEAIKQGLKHYFTGKPCKWGHLEKRSVGCRKCLACGRERMAIWAKENPEKKKQVYQKWYDASYADYCKKNKENIRKNASEWLKRNKDKANAKTAYRRATKLQRTPKWLSSEDMWLIEEAYELAQERTKLFGFMWTVDHVVPLNGETVSGLHVPENLQIIPASENYSKANRWDWELQQ